MALVFAACNNSSTDDNGGGTTDPGVVTPSKTVVSANIISGPSATDYYEGLPVDLTGIRLLVRYAGDPEPQVVTDTSKMTISPAHYNKDFNGASDASTYTLTYVEGNGAVVLPNFYYGIAPQTGKFPLGTTPHDLVDVARTGALSKQDYLVDEVPDFSGITVEGVYGSGATVGGGVDGENTEADLVHVRIPLSTDYEWRWVWNARGTEYVNDDPGVLVKIGSWGDVEDVSNSGLKGIRIPVNNLYQVDSIEFATAPSFSARNIFIDDPSLMGASADVQYAWQELLGDAVIRINYAGTTQTREVGVRELYTQFMGNKWSHDELGSLTVQPARGTRPQDTLYETAPNDPVYLLDTVKTDGSSYISSSSFTADMRADWANLRTPALAFQYRGREVRTLVPIYNRLDSIVAESRTGETIVMDGEDRVYHRPDTFGVFVDRVKVSATYSQKSDMTQKATREDVGADFKAGTLKGMTPPYDGATGIYAPFGTAGQIPDGTTIALPNGLLNQANSDAYAKSQRLQRVTITYAMTNCATAPAVLTTKTARVEIGVRNYK